MKEIGRYAFAQSGVNLVRIPEGVTAISEYAFNSCSSLTELILPETLESVGNYAFGSCSALTEVTFPGGLVSLGNGAFSSCKKLAEVELPEGLVSVGTDVFAYNTALTRARLPESLTEIGKNAFNKDENVVLEVVRGSAAETYAAENGLTAALYEPEAGSSFLETLETPEYVCAVNRDGTVTIRRWRGNSETVVVPALIGGYAVRDIGPGAFSLSTNLRQVTVENGVRSIGEYAFAVCAALEKVYLPASVTKVADNAFASCAETLSVETAGAAWQPETPPEPIPATPEPTAKPETPADPFEVITEPEETEKPDEPAEVVKGEPDPADPAGPDGPETTDGPGPDEVLIEVFKDG